MQPVAASPTLARESALWRGWSLEATLPTARDIDILRDTLAPETRVYLTALPGVPYAKQLVSAARLRAAGFEPVPHLAARAFRSRDRLSDYLKVARQEAGITKALVIAGDQNRPKGPYASSIDLISDDIFLNAGLTEVGISAYPEGHPFIVAESVDEALGHKIDALFRANMSVEIVSQFSFNAEAVVSWHDRLRHQGIVCPIRIGLAGPATAGTLLKFALRCGINLPLRQTNTAARLLRGTSADEIVAGLAASKVAADKHVSLHIYSFGGIERTAQWATEQAAGR